MLFYKNKLSKFSFVSTHLDDLLHCLNCSIMANEFKNQLIKTYTDIKYHDKASSYIGMTINRSVDLSKIYISQQGLTQRIILPDNFPSTTSPTLSHLFDHAPENKLYDRLSINHHRNYVCSETYQTRCPSCHSLSCYKSPTP